MKALVSSSNGPQLTELDPPIITHPHEVLVDIQTAGICRTDLYAAKGLIPLEDGITLGHEAAGRIATIGSSVTNLQVGDSVVINPLRSCQKCEFCNMGKPHLCSHSQFMGLDFSGAFCESVVLPSHEVFRLPANLTFPIGAYTEPLAATRAILESSLKPTDQILVYGEGRIADLTHRVLLQEGFQNLTLSGNTNHLRCFDAIVEATSEPLKIKEAIHQINPGGLLILKSRTPEDLNLPILSLIQKRVRIESVYYSDFTEALEYVVADQDWLDQLIGRSYQLADFEAAFAEAEKSEAHKTFFTFS